MSDTFNAYHVWLGIPPHEQPPNHYRLLGIALFEGDLDVIDHAADRQMAHVRTFQSGKHGPRSQHLLNELAVARLSLLDREKKSAYDEQLRARLTAAPRAMPVGAPLPQAAPVIAAAPGVAAASGQNASGGSRLMPPHVTPPHVTPPHITPAPESAPRVNVETKNAPKLQGDVALRNKPALREELAVRPIPNAPVATAPVGGAPVGSATVAGARLSSAATKPAPTQTLDAATPDADDELDELLAQTAEIHGTFKRRNKGDASWKSAMALGLLAGAIVVSGLFIYTFFAQIRKTAEQLWEGPQAASPALNESPALDDAAAPSPPDPGQP